MFVALGDPFPGPKQALPHADHLFLELTGRKLRNLYGRTSLYNYE